MPEVTTAYGTTYELTGDEKTFWLNSNQNRLDVQRYLNTHQPPYGVIINDPLPGGIKNEFLLWFDAGATLHIINVTQHPTLAEAVKKAPFESPDGSFMDNLLKEINRVAGGFQTTLMWGVVGLGLVFLLKGK